MPESAEHPLHRIQYGVSSILSGQSSATGDARAGAYYFPTYEPENNVRNNPDGSRDGSRPNEGRHFLMELGLKGQRAHGQGLTLVHFSAQPEPLLTQNTPCTPPGTPSHSMTPPKHP